MQKISRWYFIGVFSIMSLALLVQSAAAQPRDVFLKRGEAVRCTARTRQLKGTVFGIATALDSSRRISLTLSRSKRLNQRDLELAFPQFPGANIDPFVYYDVIPGPGLRNGSLVMNQQGDMLRGKARVFSSDFAGFSVWFQLPYSETGPLPRKAGFFRLTSGEGSLFQYTSVVRNMTCQRIKAYS